MTETSPRPAPKVTPPAVTGKPPRGNTSPKGAAAETPGPAKSLSPRKLSAPMSSPPSSPRSLVIAPLSPGRAKTSPKEENPLHDDPLESSEAPTSEELDETPALDLSRPVTNTREFRPLPTRPVHITKVIGEAEATHKPKNAIRPIRFFVFNPSGRCISMSLDSNWTSPNDLCAAASFLLVEPKLSIVPQPQPFTFAYFYPSMAELEELDTIRENDQLVVVTTKLEPGQLLNAVGGGRSRSASISAGSTYVPHSGASHTNEWSNIVPFVEPSYYPSTLAFEVHTTPETERYYSGQIKAMDQKRLHRYCSDHIEEILQHVETFAASRERPSHVPIERRKYNNWSTASLSSLDPSTPRGGIMMPSPRISASSSPSIGSPLNAQRLSVSGIPSLSPIEGSSDSDSIGSSSQTGNSVSYTSSRHVPEWEKSENEIQLLAESAVASDKWEEHDRSKRDRNRSLTADEEKEAKKLEKRHSKAKISQKLGTLPRDKAATMGSMRAASVSSGDAPLMALAEEGVTCDPFGKIIGLTLERLIQKLVLDSFPAVNLSKNFLLTYRLYLKPHELVAALEARWDADGPPAPGPGAVLTAPQQQAQVSAPRLRLLTFLKLWAFKHPDDFKDEQARKALFRFCTKMERSGISNLVKEMEIGMKKQATNSIGDEVAEEWAKMGPSFFPPLGGELLDFHPMELARQITLVEKAFLDDIQSCEFLNVAWTKKNKETAAAGIMAMIRWSNFVVDWMCTEILKPMDPVERAKVINRFIYVGHYCTELNNFNGTVEVLSALRRSSVYRLKRSWNFLSDRAWRVFENLEAVYEPDANYKNYRAALEKANHPCIPYVGRLLSDILFLEEKEPNSLPDGTISMAKMENLANLIKVVTDQQSHDYRFGPVDGILSYIFSQDVLNEKHAYSISLEREKKSSSESSKMIPELTPSALTLKAVVLRSDLFNLFKAYLDARNCVDSLLFYKQVADLQAMLEDSESLPNKRARELASLIFEAFISDRGDKQVPLPKDALIIATAQEVEWKIKDDSHPLPQAIFRPLLDRVTPMLEYNFEQFRRALPAAQYTLV